MRRIALICFVSVVALAVAGPAAAGYKAKIAGGTLTLTGSVKAEKVTLRLKKGASATLQVDVGSNGSADLSFARKRFTRIVVNAGGGNDAVTIAGAFTVQEKTTLNGGAGNDKLTGGSGGETFAGGPGTDALAGGGGADQFLWNPGDGNDKIDGAGGADTLNVDGSGADETFAVNPATPRIQVTAPGAILNVGTVEKVDIDGLGGNDTISGGSVALLTTLDFDGGDGFDNLSGGNGADVISGGLDADQVEGNAGNDTVFLGDGANAFVWDVGDGSDVVLGGADTDTLSVNGSVLGEGFSLAADGGALHVSRQTDGLIVESDSVEAVVVSPLEGTDSVTVDDLAGTDVTAADVDLGVLNAGDAGIDSVEVRGTAGVDSVQAAGSGSSIQVTGLAASVLISHSEAGSDQLALRGLGGGDVLAGGSLAALILLTLDGGEGDDVLLGGNGADTLLAGNGNDGVDGNFGIDTVFLGEGDDTAVWDPGDGSEILEGQGGRDELRFSGSNVPEIFSASNNGGRLLFTRNIAAITIDADGIEELELSALGGADTITVNSLLATDLDLFGIDTGVSDFAADAVIVNGTAGIDLFSVSGSAGAVSLAMNSPLAIILANAEAMNDSLTVNGGSGADQISAAGLAAATVLLTLNGGNNADILVASPGADTVNGDAGNDIIDAGDGNDTIAGGADTDYCDGGAGIDIGATCETSVNIP